MGKDQAHAHRVATPGEPMVPLDATPSGGLG